MTSYAETFKCLVVNEEDGTVKKGPVVWGRAMKSVGGDTGHRTGPMGHTVVGFTDGSAFEFERIGGDYYFVRCHPRNDRLIASLERAQETIGRWLEQDAE